jgi:hypothetical protein
METYLTSLLPLMDNKLQPSCHTSVKLYDKKRHGSKVAPEASKAEKGRPVLPLPFNIELLGFAQGSKQPVPHNSAGWDALVPDFCNFHLILAYSLLLMVVGYATTTNIPSLL